MAEVDAFVPDPVPRGLTLSHTTIRLVGDARGALGRLCEGVRVLGDPRRFIRPFMIREAVLSSRIEGTQTTLEQALVDQATGGHPPSLQRREVRNYDRALVQGAAALANGRPLSMSLLAALHTELLSGTRDESFPLGRVREEQVWLSDSVAGETDIRHAKFVPPPPDHVQPCLQDLDVFLRDEPTDDPLVRAALAHYQFETIHPFSDGNGRVGRLLIPLQMLSDGLLDGPWLYVSPYFEQRRREYYDQLHRVSMGNGFEPWVAFFAKAVLVSATDMVERLHGLQRLREEFADRLRPLRTQKPLLLIPFLLGCPYITVQGAAGELRTTNPTARAAILHLVDAGVLQYYTSIQFGLGRPADYYKCGEIVDLLRN